MNSFDARVGVDFEACTRDKARSGTGNLRYTFCARRRRFSDSYRSTRREKRETPGTPTRRAAGRRRSAAIAGEDVCGRGTSSSGVHGGVYESAIVAIAGERAIEGRRGFYYVVQINAAELTGVDDVTVVNEEEGEEEGEETSARPDEVVLDEKMWAAHPGYGNRVRVHGMINAGAIDRVWIAERSGALRRGPFRGLFAVWIAQRAGRGVIMDDIVLFIIRDRPRV